MKDYNICIAVFMNVLFIILLCAIISLSGCSNNTEKPSEPVTEPSSASQTPSKPSVDYKSLAPKPEEFADGNEFFVTGNDEKGYTYMVSAVTPDQFQICKNILTEEKFPDVVLNMSQTFIAMHEDGETCVRLFYYPGAEGGDGKDAYLILTVTAYDQTEDESNAEDGLG